MCVFSAREHKGGDSADGTYMRPQDKLCHFVNSSKMVEVREVMEVMRAQVRLEPDKDEGRPVPTTPNPRNPLLLC